MNRWREYDPEKDEDAVARIWREVGWIDGDSESDRKAFGLFARGYRGIVADIDGSPECYVATGPGSMRYRDTEVALSMALLVASGYTLTTALSTVSSLVQEHTPDDLRGRVMSIFGLAFRGGLPVGSLVGGLFVREAGVPAVMATSCALLLLLAVALLLRHRELRAL